MENVFKDILYRLGLYKFARKFLEKPYLKLMGFLFMFSAKSAIRTFVKVMDDHHYMYWLEFGTLLGAVREQGMLAHDADLDVAIPIAERPPDFEQVMRQHGFKRIKRSTLLTGELTEETYKYKTARIDIFYAHPRDDKWILYDYETVDNLSPDACMKRFGGLKVYENVLDCFDVTSYPFYDLTVNVPANYHHHLAELYGSDYMVPNKHWSQKLRTIRHATSALTRIG